MVMGELQNQIKLAEITQKYKLCLRTEKHVHSVHDVILKRDV